jgi:GDP-4-dehydro-6-deoxy-D-mannose reductase
MDVALVIAGTSFVGRHLLAALPERRVPFHTTSRSLRPSHLTCDLLRGPDVDALIEAVRPRWIFVCAGATVHSSPDDLHAVHVHATETLLQATARHAPHAVTVLFGSAAEYGPVPPERMPISEDVTPRPSSSYGQSKLAQLQTAVRLATEKGLRVHVVRPFNLIGPGLGGQYFAASLCARLRQARRQGHRGAIRIDNGHATRDWVDVRDAADAVLRLAFDAPPAAGTVGVYNIATGQETSVLTVAEHMCGLAGAFHAVDAGRTASRSLIERSAGDSGRLRAATGWQPRVPWQHSAAELWGAGGGG